jgi:uncharacterized protein
LRGSIFLEKMDEKKICLIAGGTGLIGTRMQSIFREAGYEVRVLTRKPTQPGQFAWDPARGTLDDQALEGVQVLINLAGEGIADGCWTEARKQRLIESRTQSTGTLHAALQRTGQRPSVFVSASAVGIYGNTGETLVTEDTPPVSADFMVQCCQLWEQAADTVGALGIRTVKLRIGVVLAREGGALREFERPIRLGVGGYFGNGQAWYPWVHRDDVCRMFLWAAENQKAHGVFNAVAPHPLRNLPLTRAIAQAMSRWAIFVPAPEFVIRLAFGEMAAVILNSNRVSTQKIVDAGFAFQFPTAPEALVNIYKK